MTEISHVRLTWLSRLTEHGPTGPIVRVVTFSEYVRMTDDELAHTHVEHLTADEIDARGN